MTIELVQADENGYASKEGYVMCREMGKTPNGNPMNNRWVLRDPSGKMIDFNQYRHDLACKHDLLLFHIPGMG